MEHPALSEATLDTLVSPPPPSGLAALLHHFPDTRPGSSPRLGLVACPKLTEGLTLPRRTPLLPCLPGASTGDEQWAPYEAPKQTPEALLTVGPVWEAMRAAAFPLQPQLRRCPGWLELGGERHSLPGGPEAEGTGGCSGGVQAQALG